MKDCKRERGVDRVLHAAEELIRESGRRESSEAEGRYMLKKKESQTIRAEVRVGGDDGIPASSSWSQVEAFARSRDWTKVKVKVRHEVSSGVRGDSAPRRPL